MLPPHRSNSAFLAGGVRSAARLSPRLECRDLASEIRERDAACATPGGDFAQLLARVGGIALGQEGLAQVFARLNIVRFERERTPVVGERAFDVAQLSCRKARGVEGARIFGVPYGCEQRQRFGIAARVGEPVGTVDDLVVGGAMVRFARRRGVRGPSSSAAAGGAAAIAIRAALLRARIRLGILRDGVCVMKPSLRCTVGITWGTLVRHGGEVHPAGPGDWRRNHLARPKLCHH